MFDYVAYIALRGINILDWGVIESHDVEIPRLAINERLLVDNHLIDIFQVFETVA